MGTFSATECGTDLLADVDARNEPDDDWLEQESERLTERAHDELGQYGASSQPFEVVTKAADLMVGSHDVEVDVDDEGNVHGHEVFRLSPADALKLAWAIVFRKLGQLVERLIPRAFLRRPHARTLRIVRRRRTATRGSPSGDEGPLPRSSRALPALFTGRVA